MQGQYLRRASVLVFPRRRNPNPKTLITENSESKTRTHCAYTVFSAISPIIFDNIASKMQSRQTMGFVLNHHSSITQKATERQVKNHSTTGQESQNYVHSYCRIPYNPSPYVCHSLSVLGSSPTFKKKTYAI